MKKPLLLLLALLIFPDCSSAAVRVQKTTFNQNNYNQYNHPKSLSQFNSNTPYQLAPVRQQQNSWVPTSRVIAPQVQPVAQQMTPQPEVRRMVNQPVIQQQQMQAIQPTPQTYFLTQPTVQTLAPPAPRYNGDAYIVDKTNGFFAITPKIGTQGIGLDGVVRINDYLRLRGGGNYLTYSGNHEINDIDYEYDASIANGNTFVDYHPFASGFRITGGAFYGPDELEVTSNPITSLTIGNASYTPSEIGTMKAKVETGDISPYAGIGYSDVFTANGANRHWFLEADLGVKFNDITSTASSTGTLSNDPTFNADLQREKNKVQDEFDILEYYPILNIGVTYKF